MYVQHNGEIKEPCNQTRAGLRKEAREYLWGCKSSISETDRGGVRAEGQFPDGRWNDLLPTGVPEIKALTCSL